MTDNKRAKTPVVLQMEATECGAASLAIVLAYYNLWLPLEKLRKDCGISRDGSKAKNILRAARRYGCKANAYRWPPEHIREAEYPLIIHWEFNHFLVLEGFGKDGTAYLNDPATGRRTVKWDEFVDSYTGVSIQITPTEDFKPAGKRYNVISDVAAKLLKDKWAAVFLIIIGLISLLPQLASPVMSQIFLDDILTRRHPDWMTNLLIAMTLSFILSGVLSFLRSFCLTRWQQKLTLSDSSSFFWHLLRLPIDFFNQRYAAEIASRIGFTESIAAVLSGSAATVILDFFVAIFFLLLLFHYSVPLTLIGISFSLLDLGIFFYMRRRIIDMTMRNQQYAGKAYGTAINGLKMIESVKANGNEADLFSKIAGYNAKLLDNSQEIALLSLNVSMLPMFLSGLNSALIILFGGFSIMEGVMTAGIFMAFQNLMGNFQAPFSRIIALGQELQSTEMQMQRINDVRRYEIDGLNFYKTATDIPPARLSGLVELKNVSFGYNVLEPPLLTDITLTIKPGHQVAVVGASGSGKSTLGKVTTGIYKEWSGDILFDGKRRQEIPRNIMVNSVSAVEQDVFQLTGTVRENISLFNATIPFNDIVQAAKDACIHEDILRLKGGYDADVNEGGSNFSGGQRQRLEIARALAVNPSFLVFDEATSALDPVTELSIIRNIRRRGCSCLVVAHRLSTIRDCDEIIVLDHGRIAERGTHRQMMEHDGPYRQLITMQNEAPDLSKKTGPGGEPS